MGKTPSSTTFFDSLLQMTIRHRQSSLKYSEDLETTLAPQWLYLESYGTEQMCKSDFGIHWSWFFPKDIWDNYINITVSSQNVSCYCPKLSAFILMLHHRINCALNINQKIDCWAQGLTRFLLSPPTPPTTFQSSLNQSTKVQHQQMIHF